MNGIRTSKDIHDSNRMHWDLTASHWERLRNDDGRWRRCATDHGIAFEGQALEALIEVAGHLEGKGVCVVGSGDNYAAFALAGLGAWRTSVARLACGNPTSFCTALREKIQNRNG
jgi:hypothetical protein